MTISGASQQPQKPRNPQGVSSLHGPGAGLLLQEQPWGRARARCACGGAALRDGGARRPGRGGLARACLSWKLHSSGCPHNWGGASPRAHIRTAPSTPHIALTPPGTVSGRRGSSSTGSPFSWPALFLVAGLGWEGHRLLCRRSEPLGAMPPPGWGGRACQWTVQGHW